MPTSSDPSFETLRRAGRRRRALIFLAGITVLGTGLAVLPALRDDDGASE